MLQRLSEDLYAMVLTIAHQNIAIRHNGNPFEPLELGVAGTPRAKCTQETSIRMENLYAIIARIRHADVALVVNGHAPVHKVERLIRNQVFRHTQQL